MLYDFLGDKDGKIHSFEIFMVAGLISVLGEFGAYR